MDRKNKGRTFFHSFRCFRVFLFFLLFSSIPFFIRFSASSPILILRASYVSLVIGSGR